MTGVQTCALPILADAAIASMAPQQLPENQGIARIPAPNIQGMADGGIAGYGDDANEGMAQGGMFEFAQRSEPVLRMSGGGVTGYAVGGVTREMVQKAYDDWMNTKKSWYQQTSPMSAQQEKAAEERYMQLLNAYQSGSAAKPSSEVASGADMGMPTDVGLPAKTDVSTLQQPVYKPSAAASTPPGAAPAPQSTLPTGLPSLSQAKEMSDELYDIKKMEQLVNQQKAQSRQDIQNQSEERAAKMEAFNKEQGPAYAGYEKLLKAEELQDATDKEKAGLMALMKGFLGMAAGESPNAAVNIAKGAMAGLSEYSDSLKELKKAAKERNKAMAEIENARRAEIGRAHV